MATTFRFDLATARISTLDLPTSRFVVCSRPYPVEIEDAAILGATITGGTLSTGIYTMAPENMTLGASLDSGTLRSPIQAYAWPAENATLGATIDSGELRQILRIYTDWPTENVTLGAVLDSGTLKVSLISYTNWPTENLTLGATLDSGTLT